MKCKLTNFNLNNLFIYKLSVTYNYPSSLFISFIYRDWHVFLISFQPCKVFFYIKRNFLIIWDVCFISTIVFSIRLLLLHCSKFSLWHLYYTYIWIFGLPVCLYPVNVKTAEPIGPTIFKATQITQRKVHVPKVLLVISKKNVCKFEMLSMRSILIGNFKG